MVIASRTARSDDYQCGGVAEGIVGHLPVAIVTIDERGIIRTANRATEAMFGYPPAEIVGRNVSVLIDLPDLGLPRACGDGLDPDSKRDGLGSGPREVAGRDRSGRRLSVDLTVGEMADGVSSYRTSPSAGRR